ncbi:MAG: hypothetical protein OEV99_03010 [Nitrospira sp.]|nr:hypothetical protein [Nitrospira sp.]MDH4368789.1 hypothetical protein [Nitrospira sp.]MDH5348448.1 hypothetical protein [Nitrospira sp.]MDH5495917.1 hypothetical protein [Nitrospira sp.]MDH5725148.1 hypothetical protein [Nitrospira sp.]
MTISRFAVGSALWLVLFMIKIVAAAEPSLAQVPLYDNLGTHHHPITTTSTGAQRYFDQGLRMVYAFNHDEAVLAFEAAARLDPAAAMAYWGVALALGPNINTAMDKTDERRAWEAVQKAKFKSAHVSAAERAYIDAISKRYSQKSQPRGPLDKAYAEAMRGVWRQFPDDPDAGVLFAEALMDLRPWDLWTAGGQPRPGTDDIVSTLESILAKFPDHPGACHYYIHSVEASPKPERALDCAERLPGLMPGAGHLVHMPTHLSMRLGQYHEASEQNAKAVHADENYLAGRKLKGDYADGYYTHNLYFLWSALVMEGRKTEALKVARQVAKTINEEEARRDKWKELYLPTPLWSMIRFGQWDVLLHELPPPKTLRLQQAMWRLGRGMALATSGRLPGAEGEHFVLAGLAKRIGRDRTAEEKTERALVKIAERLLAGEIATHSRKLDEAITALSDALKLEDALPYSEPPLWPIPIRHYLGALLLKSGQPSRAESVYRADLGKNPQNGWAYYGLLQSLRAQQKGREAARIEAQFKKAWEYADVTLMASRF